MGFGKKRSSKVGVGAITVNKKKLFAEGGMMDDGKDVDPVSGNDVPVGSLAEEVRDDVDAKLSPGEFVFPADVVRFIGLERLMKMRDEAKKGLSRMNDIGQMGNAEEAGEKANDTFEGEGEEDDDEFESEIDDIMREIDGEDEVGRQTEMAFNTGGFVNPAYYDLTKAPKNPALDIRYFTDSQGKQFYMPFINGKPMKPMPNGAVQVGVPTGGTTGGGGTAGGGERTGDSEVSTGSVGGGGAAGGGTTIIGGGTTGTGGGTTTDTGASFGVAGTYTGSNIADFGRSDMIYNPGGSGPSGEVVSSDLWQNSAQKWQVNLGSAALSALATAMGVPGIFTMGFRAAANKYGTDKLTEFFARANQESMARAGGYDLSTPEGKMGAGALIDEAFVGGTAASAGAKGTGSVAAEASSTVADRLRDTGLTDAEIGAAAQRAADAVIRGQSITDAINNAINSAKPDFGVRMSDIDPLYPEGSLYNGVDSGGMGQTEGGISRLDAFTWTPPAPMESLSPVGQLTIDLSDFASLNNFASSIGFDFGTMGSTSSGGGILKDDYYDATRMN